jgi:hypothetical protein
MVVLTILVLILVLAFPPARELLFALIGAALYIAAVVVGFGLLLMVILLAFA